MTKASELDQLAKILGGVLISRCAPQGSAARAGLRAGDIVLSVNGCPTPTLGDFLRARRTRVQGVALVLFRQGRQLSVELAFDPSAPTQAPNGDCAASQLDKSGSSWTLTRAWSSSSSSN